MFWLRKWSELPMKSHVGRLPSKVEWGCLASLMCLCFWSFFSLAMPHHDSYHICFNAAKFASVCFCCSSSQHQQRASPVAVPSVASRQCSSSCHLSCLLGCHVVILFSWSTNGNSCVCHARWKVFLPSILCFVATFLYQTCHCCTNVSFLFNTSTLLARKWTITFTSMRELALCKVTDDFGCASVVPHAISDFKEKEPKKIQLCVQQSYQLDIGPVIKERCPANTADYVLQRCWLEIGPVIKERCPTLLTTCYKDVDLTLGLWSKSDARRTLLTTCYKDVDLRSGLWSKNNARSTLLTTCSATYSTEKWVRWQYSPNTG